ncbi:MAG: radical SAM protein [Deltaproteobacteria bacterium]|nr:radical SAM protein [Deltaproteobacteria bacterium]
MAVRPELLQVEINTTCNLRCRICPCTASAGTRPARNVTLDEYRRVIGRSFAPPYVVVFSGFSETLLHPQLHRMVEFEKRRGCTVQVATNGTLLDDRRIGRLLDAGVDQFVVSLDSARPAVYEAVRTGASFETVLRNVLRLRDAIARRSSASKIVVNSVVLRSTAPHLGELLEFLHEHGLADLALIKVMKLAAMRNRFLRTDFLSWDEYDALPFDRLARRARALGLRMMRSDDTVLGVRGCHCPTGAFYLSAELDLSVCPMLSFAPRWVFGNLGRESIDAICRGDRFAAFRARFAAGRRPALCEDCACLFTTTA